jgi:membrane protease YdiL (CAAX protease family)
MALHRERGLAAWGICGLLLLLARGDRKTLGLSLVPRQGWLYWVKATAAIGVIVGLFVVLATGVLWLVGVEMDTAPRYTDAAQIPRDAWSALVLAPLIEEPIYRVILCAPLVAALGRAPAIVVSGVLFALIHVRYGVGAPTNFAGGFVFAWAFLKSDSLVVPVALHFLGNLVVLVGNIAQFYW